MNRDQYVESLKNKLDEWNEQISKTESEMKDASAEAQARYEELQKNGPAWNVVNDQLQVVGQMLACAVRP